MKKSFVFTLAATTLVGVATAQNTRVFIDDVEIVNAITAAGLDAPDFGPDVESMGALDADTFVVMNADEFGDDDGLPFFEVTWNGTEFEVVGVLANIPELTAAIIAAGGTDPAGNGEDLRGLDGDANGDLIFLYESDTGAEGEAFLLRIEGDGSAVTAIAGGATPNRVDGGINVIALGTTAYVVREADATGTTSNAGADEIVAFDTTATDATQTGTVVADQAALIAALGATSDADLFLGEGGSIAVLDSDSLILANGGNNGQTNGNIVRADVGASPTDPLTFTTLITGADIAAALGITVGDLEYGAIAVDAAGNIYIQLDSGSNDGDIFVIPNNGGSYSTAQFYVTLADLNAAAAAIGNPTPGGPNESSMVFVPNPGVLAVSTDDTQVIHGFDPFVATSVNDWSLY